MRYINSVICVFIVLPILLSLGCSSTGRKTTETKFDPKAAEKSRPFLSNYYGVRLGSVSNSTPCSMQKTETDWKLWVHAANSCIQKQDWSMLEKIGAEMTSLQVDSPWGPYFLGVASAERGEMLRAHWMFDLTEKKAGGSVGLVRYEKARILEITEGVPAAVSEMKQAVQVDPSLLPALLWLAQVHHRDRFYSDAEKYYRSVIALKSDEYSALVGLGDLMIENKNGNEAVELLARAISIKPEVAEIRAKLAIVYENLMKEPGKALQTLRELRVAFEKGRARGKVSFDVGAKIKQIEQTLKTESLNGQAREREPAATRAKGG